MDFSYSISYFTHSREEKHTVSSAPLPMFSVSLGFVFARGQIVSGHDKADVVSGFQSLISDGDLMLSTTPNKYMPQGN